MSETSDYIDAMKELHQRRPIDMDAALAVCGEFKEQVPFDKMTDYHRAVQRHFHKEFAKAKENGATPCPVPGWNVMLPINAVTAAAIMAEGADIHQREHWGEYEAWRLREALAHCLGITPRQFSHMLRLMDAVLFNTEPVPQKELSA